MPVLTALPEVNTPCSFAIRKEQHSTKDTRALWTVRNVCSSLSSKYSLLCSLYLYTCIETKYRKSRWASGLLKLTAGDILASNVQRDCRVAEMKLRPVVVVVVVVVQGNNG